MYMNSNKNRIPNFTADLSLLSRNAKDDLVNNRIDYNTVSINSIIISQNITLAIPPTLLAIRLCPPCQPCDPITHTKECFKYKAGPKECISYYVKC